ncbi:hypothetical protein AB1Y20_004320 [Prymnesium parvum]|uniref:SAP domain-containing protein n=2 Tax=Prymnesium parvum TaxID=97485 RepID=A0AB34IW20_PRYPA
MDLLLDDAENEYAELGAESDKEIPQKDCVLFIIDAHERMTRRSHGEPSPFMQALRGVINTMQDRILTGDNDMFGVLLYGTKKAQVPNDHQGFPHIFLLQELDLPSAESISKLNRLLESKEDPAFGHLEAHSSETCDFSNVLWVTSMIFNTSKQAKQTRRRAYIITDNDSPTGSSSSPRQQAITRACSFWREIMSKVRTNYKGTADAQELELLNPENLSDSWVHSAVCFSEDELASRLKRRSQRKRILGRLKLKINEDTEFSGCMVSMIRSYAKPPAIKLDAATNEEIKTHTMRICNVHGTSLQPVDLWRGYCYGGKWILFEPWELKALGREDSEQGLVLLGFKPRDRLKLYHNMKPAGFWQPLETRAGSTVAVEALVESLHKKERFAVCTYRRSTSEVRLVALLPQPLQLDPNTNSVVMPCGLYVIQLPFAEDIRELKLLPSMTESEFTPTELEAAHELVRSLKLAQAPVGTVPNPLMHKHYAYLRAVATHESDTKPTVDGTLPDAIFLEERRGPIRRFMEAFNLPSEAPTSSASSSKKPKAEKIGPPQSTADWKELWQTQGLTSQTMTTLKSFLKELGLPVSGKKADLIARIQEHLLAEATDADTLLLGNHSLIATELAS